MSFGSTVPLHNSGGAVHNFPYVNSTPSSCETQGPVSERISRFPAPSFAVTLVFPLQSARLDLWSSWRHDGVH